MVKLPRLGPKLAAPPTDLDDSAQERLDEFLRMAGDAKVVNTRRLLWLAVVFAGPLKLKDQDNVKRAGEKMVLTPHTVVMTPQEHVGVAKVSYYLEQLDAGEQLKPARITDAGRDAGLWHLDGLHRLLAARIMGESLEADVYR